MLIFDIHSRWQHHNAHSQCFQICIHFYCIWREKKREEIREKMTKREKKAKEGCWMIISKLIRRDIHGSSYRQSHLSFPSFLCLSHDLIKSFLCLFSANSHPYKRKKNLSTFPLLLLSLSMKRTRTCCSTFASNSVVLYFTQNLLEWNKQHEKSSYVLHREITQEIPTSKESQQKIVNKHNSLIWPASC